MTYNAAERKAVRQAEKAAAQAERQRKEFTVTNMSYTAGRKWFWDQLSRAHIFASSFSLDPLQMAFTEGERNVGLAMLADLIEWCPDQFTQMLRENNARPDTGSSSGSDDPNLFDADPDPAEPA